MASILDGTPDGRATAKTCKQEKFTGLGLARREGRQSDARVLAAPGYQRRPDREFYNTRFRPFQINRHLIEISASTIGERLSCRGHFYKGYTGSFAP